MDIRLLFVKRQENCRECFWDHISGFQINSLSFSQPRQNTLYAVYLPTVVITYYSILIRLGTIAFDAVTFLI